MTENSSNLKLAERIFTAPAEAFRTLPPGYSWAVPFLAVLGLSLAAWVFYYLRVDIAWLADHQVNLLGKDLTEEEAESARSMLGRGFQLTMAIGTVLVLVPGAYVLQALYFNAVGALQGDSKGFRQWFSFVSWTSLPTVLVLLAMIAYVAASGDRLATEELNLLSVDGLLLRLPAESPWKVMLSNISIATIWSIALMIVGYRLWVGASLLKSAVIVLAPYLLVYGVWAFFIVR